MKLRTILTLCVTGAMLLTAGCDDDKATETEAASKESTAEATAESSTASETETAAKEAIPTVEPSGKYPQLAAKSENEVIAVMKTTKGDITLRLFPDKAPKAVENFVTHAKEGYYDGLTFHRVINGFMIQGGDPNGNGTGGQSIYGEKFDDEITDKMRSFRGSLCMANSGPDTNGSQFYIVQSKAAGETYNSIFKTLLQNQGKYMKDLDDGTKSMMLQLFANQDQFLSDGSEVRVSDIYPQEVIYEYMRNGGCPFLDFGYTIFGQVKDGMEVVDTIAAVKTNASDKPLEDVIINSIEVTAITE